jgi:hypothetical protein
MPQTKLALLTTATATSPVSARTIYDLKLDEDLYKPDFEITAKFQAFSKELARLSLLGIGVYGFLIKMGAEEPQRGNGFLVALIAHHTLAGIGVLSFAVCAACSLFHGFLASKCLGYQLVIVRYFNRLEGNRWEESNKEQFREIIKKRQAEQRLVLRVGGSMLLIATLTLILGAVLVAICSILVIAA